MSCSGCGRQNPELPGKARQMRNAFEASKRLVHARLKGAPVRVDAERFNRRLEVCLECDFVIVRQTPARPYHRCAQCGCWLDGDYLAKARLATESCPVGKWEGEGTATR